MWPRLRREEAEIFKHPALSQLIIKVSRFNIIIKNSRSCKVKRYKKCLVPTNTIHLLCLLFFIYLTLFSYGLVQACPGDSGPQICFGKEKHNLQSICYKMTSSSQTRAPSTVHYAVLISVFQYVHLYCTNWNSKLHKNAWLPSFSFARLLAES